MTIEFPELKQLSDAAMARFVCLSRAFPGIRDRLQALSNDDALIVGRKCSGWFCTSFLPKLILYFESFQRLNFRGIDLAKKNIQSTLYFGKISLIPKLPQMLSLLVLGSGSLG